MEKKTKNLWLNQQLSQKSLNQGGALQGNYFYQINSKSNYKNLQNRIRNSKRNIKRRRKVKSIIQITRDEKAPSSARRNCRQLPQYPPSQGVKARSQQPSLQSLKTLKKNQLSLIFHLFQASIKLQYQERKVQNSLRVSQEKAPLKGERWPQCHRRLSLFKINLIQNRCYLFKIAKSCQERPKLALCKKIVRVNRLHLVTMIRLLHH